MHRRKNETKEEYLERAKAIRRTPEYRLRNRVYQKRRRQTLESQNYRRQLRSRLSEKERRKRNNKNRWHNDPIFRLKGLIKMNLRRSLKSKSGQHWEDLVGYTAAELKQHIENNFLSGMSWSNYGSWHIDHKIPMSWWCFTSAQDLEFKQCWSLCNLQPLWAIDNWKKNNRYVA